MTYEENRAYLSRYRDAVARAQELAEDIARLQAQAERITPRLTGMPGARTRDPMSAIEDRKEDKQRQLARLSSRLAILRRQTLRAIRAAPPPCRKLLALLYITGLPVPQAAARLSISRSQAYRLRYQGIISIPL